MSEKQYVETMINLFGREGKMFAMVGDSYNIYEFCKMLGTDADIRASIISNGERGGFTVIRPDSGNPSEVVTKCLFILEKAFGSVKNSKGFRVLNNVRIIQGDGIDQSTIRSILFSMEIAGFSADNVAFGQGGALLQQVNRDTLGFAMKCSSTGVRQADGTLKWIDVFKAPVTDPGKKSKRGRVTLYRDRDGSYRNGVEDWETPFLRTVYEDGKIFNEMSFDEVRANARV